MRWSPILTLCAAATAYVPRPTIVPFVRCVSTSPRLTVRCSVEKQTPSGLALQSRSGGVTPRVVLRASNDDDGAKIDLSTVDWSKADKVDAWAQWKNTIYFGSVAIAVLLPVFFLVVK